MAEIMVNPAGLQGASDEYRSIVGTLNNIRSEISGVKSGLGFQLPARAQIERSLDGISESVERFSRSATSMSSAILSIQRAYASTEDKLSGANVSPHGINPGAFGAVAGGIIGAWTSAGRDALGWLNGKGNSGGAAGGTSFWDNVKSAFGNVVQAGKDCFSWIKDSYSNKGIVYTIAQYGKAAAKVIGGVSAVALSIGTIIGTAGGSTPLAVASIAYGINDIVSGAKDVFDISSNLADGKTAEIEENNLLKDGAGFIVGGVGGAIGEVFGNGEIGREIGERIGAGAYDVGKIATSVYNISTGIDKLKQATPTNWSGVASEAKTTVKGSWDIFARTDYSITNLKSEVAYQAKLLSYEIPHTVNAYKNVSSTTALITNIFGEPKDMIKDVIMGNKPEPGGIIGKGTSFVRDVAM